MGGGTYVAVTAMLGGTPEGIVAATGWSQMSVAAELMLAIVLVAVFVPTLTEPLVAHRVAALPTEEQADVEPREPRAAALSDAPLGQGFDARFPK